MDFYIYIFQAPGFNFTSQHEIYGGKGVNGTGSSVNTLSNTTPVLHTYLPSTDAT